MKTKLLKRLRRDARKVYEDVIFVPYRGMCLYGTETEFPFPKGRSVLKYQGLSQIDTREHVEKLCENGRRSYILERVKRMRKKRK